MWHTIWRFTAAIASSCLLAAPALAEDLHFHGESIVYEQTSGLVLLEGQAYLLWGDYRLEAQEIIWDPAARQLEARGQILLSSPTGDIRAERLMGSPDQLLRLEQGQLAYGPLQLRFAHGLIQPDLVWLHQAQVTLPNLPPIQAAEVRLFPHLMEENLQLYQAQVGDLPLLPELKLSVPINPPAHLPPELRPQNSPLQPQLGWSADGLSAGLQIRLLEQPEQRLYVRLNSLPQARFVPGVAYEWRPRPDLVTNTDMSWQGQFQGQQDLLWQLASGAAIQADLRIGRANHFLSSLLLPPTQALITPLPASTQAIFSSEWYYWGGQWRWIGGVQAATTTLQSPIFHRQASVSAQYISPRWALGSWGELYVSGMLNGLWTDKQDLPARDLTSVTSGARLLLETQVLPALTTGLYLEGFVSDFPRDYLLNPAGLEPRLGTYLLWDAQPGLALGAQAEVSLQSGVLISLDGLVSWEWQPFLHSLLVRTQPFGIQLQSQVGVF